MVKESDLPPPPAYQQEEPAVAASPPPKYGGAAAIPLPTYAQSEKFEKEGLLQVPANTSDEDTVEDSQPVRRWNSDGTCLEFTLFFIGKSQRGTGGSCGAKLALNEAMLIVT